MSWIVIPALAKARRVASTGPRPMISGLRALTPVATIRASGVRPSSAARRSLMITTAAAPSFSGQQLPAVTVPSGRKTGLSAETASIVVPGRGPSSVLTTRAVGQRDRCDLGVEDLVRDRLLGKVLRADAELVLLGAGDAAEGGDVLRGLAHRDVDVGQLAVLARIVPRLVARGGGQAALLGRGEDRVVGVDRVDAGGAEAAVPRDALHPGGDEGVALAGLDRVEGHPGGLHAGGAEAVDRGGRDAVQSELDGDPAGHIAAVLVARLGAADVEVVQRARVERRDLGQRGADHPGGKIVGTNLRRAIPCPRARSAYARQRR